MKGTLKKLEQWWFVEFVATYGVDNVESWISIHPDNSKHQGRNFIEFDGQEIYSGENVEFDIVKYIDPKNAGKHNVVLEDCAKLIKTEAK